MHFQQHRVPSTPFKLGRWIVCSTLLIVISTIGTGYGTTLWSSSQISAFFTMIGLPSLCVGIAQYRLLAPNRPRFSRWIGLSSLSTATGLGLGWMLVLASVTLVNKYSAGLAIRYDDLASAILFGSVCGMITGSVTGICASLGQWIAIRGAVHLNYWWIGANMSSWGCGLALIGALVFGMLSQASLSL